MSNSDDTHPNVVSDNPIHSLNFDIDIFSCLSLGDRLEQQPDWKSRYPPIPSTHVPSENWSVKLRAEIHRHKSIQKSWPEPGEVKLHDNLLTTVRGETFENLHGLKVICKWILNVWNCKIRWEIYVLHLPAEILFHLLFMTLMVKTNLI